MNLLVICGSFAPHQQRGTMTVTVMRSLLLLVLASPAAVAFAPSAFTRAPTRLPRGAATVDDPSIDAQTLCEMWGAAFEQQTALRSGGFRFTSRDSDYEVKALDERVVLEREGGLGIELVEMANNQKGVGIVVVEALLEGGNADREGSLRPGDVIVACGPEGGPLKLVEATPWDETVGALGAVEGDRVEMIVKRLVRIPKVDVTLKMAGADDQSFSVFAGENLRQAMLARGVKLNDPLARRFDSGGTGDCGAEGTCTTCAVAVLEGEELLSQAKTQEKQMLAKKPRWRLACKARVGAGGQEGSLVLRVNPRQDE